MSYESQTPVFGLPQWMMTDKISMLDFNEAFLNIDNKAVPTSRTINGKPLTQDIIIDVESNFLAAYPVGALFFTTTPTNPGTLYGGTWVAWGGGRTPVGVNPADTDFNPAGKTGGEKTHVLTIAESPAHTHTTSVYWNGAPGSNIVVPQGLETNDPRKYNFFPETSSVGGGQAHNNLQPYITCYIWKRTT